MFGKGVYLADMSSKSANYCAPHISDGHALLLLCEAELGDPMYELTGASYTAGDDAIKSGSFSTWGKGNTGPQGWKDAKCINPSLEGVKMVSPVVLVLQISLTHCSRIPQRLQERPMSLALICCTTSTSATTSPRFVCATCCG